MRRYLRCPGAICCPARRALGACCSHIWFCDELIADALSPLPRECGASAYQLAAADAPCAASRADAFRIASTVALACATTLVLVRRREDASHHAVAASRPSGRGGGAGALAVPAWPSMARPGARARSGEACAKEPFFGSFARA